MTNNNPTDEFLEELATTRILLLDWGYVRVGDEIVSMAYELLQYRKAAREPVADVVAWHKTGEERTCDIRWRRFDVSPGQLYAAPPLTAAESAELQQYRNNYQWREQLSDDQ